MELQRNTRHLLIRRVFLSDMLCNSGDSWRARGTHICELQFNMTYLGMKIDFGGLDRWDFSERRRNMDEASLP
jgi:hypothetical protein